MELNPQDITISNFNTGSNWFIKMNGITITHVPTGIKVSESTGRSEYVNRSKAFQRLKVIFNRMNPKVKQ